jgi:hypothetical protein
MRQYLKGEYMYSTYPRPRQIRTKKIPLFQTWGLTSFVAVPIHYIHYCVNIVRVQEGAGEVAKANFVRGRPLPPPQPPGQGVK